MAPIVHGLILGNDGYYYGTTSFGGTNGGSGAIFRFNITTPRHRRRSSCPLPNRVAMSISPGAPLLDKPTKSNTNPPSTSQLD